MMSYSKLHHDAQMSARVIDEQLLKAMATEGYSRDYHTREALKEFIKLSGFIHALAIHEEPALSPEAA